MRETFHVHCLTPSGGKYRLNVMADDKDAARRYAEASGRTVDKVRRAPTPPAARVQRRY